MLCNRFQKNPKLVKFGLRLIIEKETLLADKVWEQQEGNWLRLLRSGDHQAFAEFVDKYKSEVFLCCRTLGLRDDEAEDVASETFLAVYKGLSRYRGQAKLGTWLWRIAYRQGVNYLRKNRRKWPLLAEPEEQLAEGEDVDMSAGLESEEQAEFVWQAVGRLPRLWAVAIVLFYREEKSILEIAKIMKKRKNTVKTYLFRGR
ncbi:MAG: sigma-70 family RNA polymerase sigma factor, partial [Desulfobacteraceae bacterium]